MDTLTVRHNISLTLRVLDLTTSGGFTSNYMALKKHHIFYARSLAGTRAVYVYLDTPSNIQHTQDCVYTVYL